MNPIEKPVNIFEQSANFKPDNKLQTWLIGRPLATADAPHQTIGKLIGLAVFASDALSSMAYATQEIMIILAAAGSERAPSCHANVACDCRPVDNLDLLI